LGVELARKASRVKFIKNQQSSLDYNFGKLVQHPEKLELGVSKLE
jgi:hypothetical protein